MFIPTLLNFYPILQRNIYYDGAFDNNKEFKGNLRYIKFNYKSRDPAVWTISNFNELMNARKNNYLFSRKFDLSVDSNIVKKIFKLVLI